MTQAETQAHIPGPWDPLPEGYWVKLVKVRPTETGYYYLMVPAGSSSILSYCHSASGRFKPETVAASFGPRARNHAKAEANKRRHAAEASACEGISTEALEAGVVADLLTACEKTMAIALEIGERAVKVATTSHGKFAAATVKDDASRYIRAVKNAIAKARPS